MVLAHLHTFGNDHERKGCMWTFKEWNPSSGIDWLKRFEPTSETMFVSRVWREVLQEQKMEAKLIHSLYQKKENTRKRASSTIQAAAAKQKRYLSLMTAAKTHDVGQERICRAEKKKLAREYASRQAEKTLKANKATKKAKKRAKKARKKTNRRAREAQQAKQVMIDPMDLE
jgi:16S rRNA G1207 methylase RsmC